MRITVVAQGLEVRIVAGQIQAIHTDQVGRPEVVTDYTKAVVWRARSFAFDRPLVQDNVVPLNLDFAGQYYDEESDLNSSCKWEFPGEP